MKKIIAGVTIVLVVAGIVLALVPFDSPELGRRLLARLGERRGSGSSLESGWCLKRHSRQMDQR